MPNQPDPSKTVLTVRMSRPLYAKIQKLAKQTNRTMTELVIGLVEDRTREVTLTSEDYEKIAKEMRRAEQRRSRSGH